MSYFYCIGWAAVLAALRVPRAEYVRGRLPVVPDWARSVVRKRGGAWFFGDGCDVKGARCLVRPAADPSRDGRPGWSFVLDWDGRHVMREYDMRKDTTTTDGRRGADGVNG